MSTKRGRSVSAQTWTSSATWKMEKIHLYPSRTDCSSRKGTSPWKNFSSSPASSVTSSRNAAVVSSTIRLQELCPRQVLARQHESLRRAQLRVVREGYVLEPVGQGGLGSEASHARRHAALGVTVEPRLGAERVVVHDDGTAWRARQVEAPVVAPEAAHDLRGGGGVAGRLGLDRDRGRVAVENGCPGARRADERGIRLDAALDETAEDLP